MEMEFIYIIKMMYVEGGYFFDAKVETVAKWTDILVAVVLGAASITLCVKRLVVMRGMGVMSAVAKETVTRLGLKLAIAYTVINIIAKVFEFTPGVALAIGLDCIDRSGQNGRVQF